MINNIESPTAWVRTNIKKFINESPENTLKNNMNDKAWAEPLIGPKLGHYHW